MKLLLTDSGVRNESILAALVDLLGKPIAEASALCIPTAGYGEPGGPWHFISGRSPSPMTELGWKSVGVLELTALPGIDKDRWVSWVREADALLVNGGSIEVVSEGHWKLLNPGRMNAGDREPAIEAVLAGAKPAVTGPGFSVRVAEDEGRPAAGANNYDSFAEAYTAETEANLINGYYTRPAVLDLAGDVAGRRILDVGCGSGPLSAALRDRGAVVTGLDSSAGMLKLARLRLGPGADLRLADLGSPLPFDDGTFDDVVAALVLHYLQDWSAPLAELRRVLKPGGRLIVAVDHPFAVNIMHRDAGRKPDYFATYDHTAEWAMRGQTARMSFWHRPLHAMTDAFTAAGFRVAVISEPPPAPGARELFPDILADVPTAFLCFLFFVLQAD